MKNSPEKRFFTDILSLAGITLNGASPWDMHVHNEKTFDYILQYGTLGLGESYMNGWWDANQLDEFFNRVLNAKLYEKITTPYHLIAKAMLSRLINFQTKTRSKEVGMKHYDLGNNLFEKMLDKNMVYSCAYFNDTDNLDKAQINKMDLICRKLQLKPGMRVLDIGCGFGSLAKFMAEHYHVEVVGITISNQQKIYAEENCKRLPIEIRLMDYRDLNETFDAIVSVGMFEHVGHLNYQTYMQTVHRSLKGNGVFLLHTIGSNESTHTSDPWILKYIFPNSMLPSVAQIAKASEKKFVMEDWQSIGAYYDPTLMAWHKNFNHAWPVLKSQYDDRFFRMWNYYLLLCAGSFRARVNQCWQIVFSKEGVKGGYPRYS